MEFVAGMQNQMPGSYTKFITLVIMGTNDKVTPELKCTLQVQQNQTSHYEKCKILTCITDLVWLSCSLDESIRCPQTCQCHFLKQNELPTGAVGHNYSIQPLNFKELINLNI